MSKNSLDEITSTKKKAKSTPLVQNFRQAASLPFIYRCASTDSLASLFAPDIGNATISSNSSSFFNSIHPNDEILLYKAGLILDLRSPSERNEDNARCWMNQAPGGSISVEAMRSSNESLSLASTSSQSSAMRKVLRIDVLSPSRLFSYMTNNWFTPTQKALSILYYIINGNKLHELRMDVMNERNLSGLYEAILQTSQVEICVALKAITEFLEKNDVRNYGENYENRNLVDSVVVHCVKGKDRTGIIVMLCQSMIGLSDKEIIHDYHLSDNVDNEKKSFRRTSKGKLNRDFFSGAPKESMEKTLCLLRNRYGSVCPGYLDAIGFDGTWRERFLKVVKTGNEIFMHNHQMNNSTSRM